VRPVVVTLHAHPDDEAMLTGGTIVRAVRAGWRVVLIVATEGVPSREAGGSDLDAHRRAETLAAARVLGVERVEFLGYGDSGGDAPSGADPRDTIASARALRSGTLAAAHVEVAVRSIEGTSCEHYESTIGRSALRRLRNELVGRGLVSDLWPSALSEQLGVEDGPTLATVDVTAQLDHKLAAVAAHSSQDLEATTFMGLPAGAFSHLLSTEWFRVARARAGVLSGDAPRDRRHGPPARRRLNRNYSSRWVPTHRFGLVTPSVGIHG
jgi:LmbE family N-acetylglucosaminyl deacetylase